ncbi:MAG: BREX-6 system BrxE protein [Myxococcota bacterium]|nr:BREX-6 system BrxE protein [Myxococcota bacterium]
MAAPISNTVLDEILALQLTVAWAGEASCSPKRLGWWRTDLIDPAGGGDLMARLAPRTHVFAGLEAVREAALRADAKIRGQQPDPDRLRTLFYLGFAFDEHLGDRLAHHKRSGLSPAECLPLLLPLGVDFSVEALASVLKPAGANAEHTVVPGGRQLKGSMPDEPAQAAQQLAASLVPFAESYPMPFYVVK